MTIPGTLAQADKAFVVCLFKVDGQDLVHEFKTFGSEVVARHMAQGDVAMMHAVNNGLRSVSIQRPDGSWETLGSFYDVGASRERDSRI